MKSSKDAFTQSPKCAILRLAYSGFCWIPPVLRRLFEVNSELHTGARPSARLCVGLTSFLSSHARKSLTGFLRSHSLRALDVVEHLSKKKKERIFWLHSARNNLSNI